MNILAIIPARGGSKSLVDKNIIDLLDKPLIAWTIEASLNSKYITNTVVSSDSESILEIAKQYKAKTIKRPDILATDTASSESAVTHILETLTSNGENNFDYVVLLQPTSPLRNNVDIDNAFNDFFNKDADSLISVYSIDNKILKSFKTNDSGYIEGIVNNEYPFMRRQNLPKTYTSNGAIYVVKVSEFINKPSFITDKTIMFEMDNNKSIDIDSLDDLDRAKKYLLSD